MRQSNSFQKDPVIKNSRHQSNFRAIKNLIQAETSIRVAHNRIKVLQINEEKNNHKFHNQVGLIEKIQQVREFSALHNQTVQTTKMQMHQESEEAKNKYMRLNQQHKSRIKQVYEGINRTRRKLYMSIEEKSQDADRQISEEKLRDQHQKAKIREKIAAQEQYGKQSLVQFQESKQNHIKTNKASEIQLIKQKQAKKYKELRDLSNVEMQLIQKQSQSQAAYRQVKTKLDSLLNNVKIQNNQSKKSLKTSIHLQGRENKIQN